MTVALALVAAVLYGLSDFVGGAASRRTSVWPVGLSWMAAGYNAAQVIAQDAGIWRPDWWSARPCEWYLGNLDRLVAGA